MANEDSMPLNTERITVTTNRNLLRQLQREKSAESQYTTSQVGKKSFAPTKSDYKIMSMTDDSDDPKYRYVSTNVDEFNEEQAEAFEYEKRQQTNDSILIPARLSKKNTSTDFRLQSRSNLNNHKNKNNNYNSSNRRELSTLNKREPNTFASKPGRYELVGDDVDRKTTDRYRTLTTEREGGEKRVRIEAAQIIEESRKEEDSEARQLADEAAYQRRLRRRILRHAMPGRQQQQQRQFHSPQPPHQQFSYSWSDGEIEDDRKRKFIDARHGNAVRRDSIGGIVVDYPLDWESGEEMDNWEGEREDVHIPPPSHGSQQQKKDPGFINDDDISRRPQKMHDDQKQNFNVKDGDDNELYAPASEPYAVQVSVEKNRKPRRQHQQQQQEPEHQQQQQQAEPVNQFPNASIGQGIAYVPVPVVVNAPTNTQQDDQQQQVFPYPLVQGSFSNVVPMAMPIPVMMPAQPPVQYMPQPPMPMPPGAQLMQYGASYLPQPQPPIVMYQQPQASLTYPISHPHHSQDAFQQSSLFPFQKDSYYQALFPGEGTKQASPRHFQSPAKVSLSPKSKALAKHSLARSPTRKGDLLETDLPPPPPKVQTQTQQNNQPSINYIEENKTALRKPPVIKSYSKNHALKKAGGDSRLMERQQDDEQKQQQEKASLFPVKSDSSLAASGGGRKWDRRDKGTATAPPGDPSDYYEGDGPAEDSENPEHHWQQRVQSLAHRNDTKQSRGPGVKGGLGSKLPVPKQQPPHPYPPQQQHVVERSNNNNEHPQVRRSNPLRSMAEPIRIDAVVDPNKIPVDGGSLPLRRTVITEDGEKVNIDINLKMLTGRSVLGPLGQRVIPPPQPPPPASTADYTSNSNHHAVGGAGRGRRDQYEQHEPMAVDDDDYSMDQRDHVTDRRRKQRQQQASDNWDDVPVGRRTNQQQDHYSNNQYRPSQSLASRDDSQGTREARGGYVKEYQKQKKTSDAGYKKYTLNDYRRLKDDLSTKMGGLGPNLDETKREKLERQKSYGRKVSDKLKHQDEETGDSRHPPALVPVDEGGASRRRSTVQREPTRVVPKPKVRQPAKLGLEKQSSRARRGGLRLRGGGGGGSRPNVTNWLQSIQSEGEEEEEEDQVPELPSYHGQGHGGGQGRGRQESRDQGQGFGRREVRDQGNSSKYDQRDVAGGNSTRRTSTQQQPQSNPLYVPQPPLVPSWTSAPRLGGLTIDLDHEMSELQRLQERHSRERNDVTQLLHNMNSLLAL